MTGFRKDELYQIDPSACPKFNSCSAPICPLDPDWQLRSHLPGERVCLWLREIAKQSDLTGSLPGKPAEVIAEAYPEILSRHNRVRRVCDDAAKNPSTRGRVPPPQRRVQAGSDA